MIWGRIRTAAAPRGKPIAIETCAAGAGNVAIPLSLFVEDQGGGPVVELVSNGTGYRVHRCAGAIAPGSSHSAGSFKRKAKVKDRSSVT